VVLFSVYFLIISSASACTSRLPAPPTYAGNDPRAMAVQDVTGEVLFSEPSSSFIYEPVKSDGFPT
jgi:hypothetical protein